MVLRSRNKGHEVGRSVRNREQHVYGAVGIASLLQSSKRMRIPRLRDSLRERLRECARCA